MDFLTLNPYSLAELLPSANNPFSAMILIFLNGGWILFVLFAFWALWTGRLEYIRNKYDSKMKYALLAIDIPRGNEQSPKAVEHIFSHLYGIKKTGNLKDKYLKGYTQMNISLELISIEGYIQYLIHTPVKFRDVVEAAIYAQYPEAEITEVEDYVDMIPKPLELPHEIWDIWGSELRLARPEQYPIRTWPFFEHSLSQKLMDPMASLLELMSRMGPGEHLWIQIIIQPVGNDWRKKGEALINKLIGKKSEKKISDRMYFPREIVKGLSESFTAGIVPPTEMDAMKKKNESEWPSMMQHLGPYEKEIVESVSMKISKLGFKSKVRFVYAAYRDRFNKPKAVNGLKGAFSQFSTQNLNSLWINRKTRTKIDYFFIKTRVLARKRRLLWAYRGRSMKRGRKGYVLNIEELASLWHFPVMEVQTPSVQKVDAKKAQAPIDLPLEMHTATVRSAQSPQPATSSEKISQEETISEIPQRQFENPPIQKGAPPSNLPMR